ncbi:oxidoreductase [Burkholderia pseudomallei]|nr:oxidoreductase [Burkholderia pseudomallei]
MGDTVHARSSNGRWLAETPLCAGSGAGPVRPGLRRATRGALAPERPARARSHSRAMCLDAIGFD